MANQTLRALAKKHAEGGLDKEAYRKSRAELIRGIVAASIPLLEIKYPPLVRAPEPEKLDDTQRKDNIKKPPVENKQAAAASSPAAHTASTTGNTPDPDSNGSSKLLFIGLAVVVVVVIVVALFVLWGNSSSQINSSISTDAGGAARSSVAPPQTRTQAQDMIQGFLDKNNWSSSNLDDFQLKWAEIATGDRLASRDSLEMGQLTNAIYKQLLEEQALSGLVDDDSSLVKQEELVQFATALGIDDPRITRPEELESVEEIMENMDP